MADDLISRAEMLADLKAKAEAMDKTHLPENAKIAGRMIQYLEGFPAAGGDGVRHGQWMYGETDNVFITEIYCPWCGKPAMYPEDEDRPLETPFCPHCGAIMDATKPDPSWPFYDASLKEKSKMNK